MGRSRALGFEMHAAEPDPEEENLILSISFTMQDAALSTDNEGKSGEEWLAGQEKYEALFRELDRAHQSCFHLDMWAMNKARRMMFRLGMLDLDVPSPHSLTAESFGVTAEMLKIDYPAFPEAFTPPELQAMQKARTALLEGAVEDPKGIPPFKLGSNDNWLITPEELTAGLKTGDERYRNTDETLETALFFSEAEFWPEWIAFLRYCAAHGGLRVG